MNFFEYLEASYANANYALQKKFSLFTQAETHAVQELINAQRKFFKFLSYFKLTFKFVLYKLGFLHAPKSVEDIREEIKAHNDAQAKAYFDASKVETSDASTEVPSSGSEPIQA